MVANGEKTGILADLFAGKPVGTLVLPQSRRLKTRQHWIAYTKSPRGRVVVDAGARRALESGKKSLLPSGVKAVEGRFREGDSVEIVDEQETSIAYGLVNYRAGDLDKIKGVKTGQIESVLGYRGYDEVVHRDNMILTSKLKLKGGSEALRSNLLLAELIQKALEQTDIPAAAVQVIPTPDRTAVQALLALEEEIDLVIPRGGEGLIRYVVQNAAIPVLKHYKGVCHVYVDRWADLAMAEEISFNAKVQRPGVCNAMETLLVHEGVAGEFLPSMVRRFQQAGVALRGCEKTRQWSSAVTAATKEDWREEFHDLILAVKVAPDMDAALDHIDRYGTRHTEAIVTRDYSRARRFLTEVDSSAVLVNASTRFNDGSELGLGAEIGISTSKLHAFGPMGLTELTTTKFIVTGDGQIRE